MSRCDVLALCIVACNAAAPVQTPPRTAPANNQIIWKAPELSGVVTLDGEPVRYFGITLTQDQRFVMNPARSVQTSDGFFFVKAEPGTWDVIIAGPGFARKVIPKVKLTRNKPTMLGDIQVAHGDSVSGLVLDAAGHPAAGAIVSITPHAQPVSDDLLSELARGCYSTVSDEHGRFLIEDVVEIGPDRRTIFAASPRGVSHQQAIRPNRTLQLLPTGAVRGFVVGYQPSRDLDHLITVSLHSKTHRSVFVEIPKRDGTFAFENIPTGDYHLQVRDTREPFGERRDVSVLAGQVVSLAL